MDQNFWLNTKDTTYIFCITSFGHLEHIYYGPDLTRGNLEQNIEETIKALQHKNSVVLGASVNYSKENPTYCLDHMCLEWSGTGRGDYRNSPLELKMPDGSFVHDFIYQSAQIVEGTVPMLELPGAYAQEGECTSLIVEMEDVSNQVYLKLIYSVFEETNVITRRAILTNGNKQQLVIRRALSMSLDLPNRDFLMHTFDGSWIREAHHHQTPITPGTQSISSTTGGSSNRHNPGILVAEKNTTENSGWAYGFNLIYSGNHYAGVELTTDDLVRVQMGINSHCFEWELKNEESFETPEVVLTFSDKGLNGVSQQFHSFIQEHIVRGDWKKKIRPVKVNNWEAFFFDFNQSKLLKLAKRAKDVGVELFVLDDGWFGARNNDHAGLGDYQVNQKKLPSGMKGLADKINQMGLLFGLWFEPEMVNEDSDLYRAHPEYAVKVPGKEPTLGRNQMVLDLCQKEVQDYIIQQVSSVLDESNITYVKWDMNRHMSEIFSKAVENQGEFYHRYILGLYRVLREIFYQRPHILLESCSSGGNRFDLGMLCFSPQIWASDNTDPIERLKIQGGLSYLYPLSTMGAHVSNSPHQQTLRETTLATRFNVAAFGCLGYELDLKNLTKVELKEVKGQIDFYKTYRQTLQFGKFSRIEQGKDNKLQWQVTERAGEQAITGFFQTISNAAESFDYLKVEGLDVNSQYHIFSKPQSIYIKRFGGLIKHLLPIELKPDGFILRTANKVYCLQEGIEQYEASGKLLEGGVLLNNQYMGTGYDEKLRLFGDFGSNLYVTKKI